MRIIAGLAKGRRLTVPKGGVTRPFTDRTKEAVFSSLGSVVGGSSVLDAYAGSGSLGLEALSRGAAGAVFVERDRAALVALRSNVASVGLGGEVVAGDVLASVARFDSEFDIAFVDPPYDLPDDDVAVVLEAISARLAAGGVLVLHRRSGGGVPGHGVLLRLDDRRRYGDGEVLRYVKVQP